MTPQENQLKALFLKTQEVAKRIQNGLAKPSQLKPAQRKLVDLLQKEGPAGLLKFLLQGVGRLYRTADGDLVFFRQADHKLYDLERQAFEQYLILLTDSVTGVRQQWLPKLRAWTRFEAEEVTTHFVAYNDSPDLNVIAINTFDGYMWVRKRGGKWRREPNGTCGVLFLTPLEFLTPWEPDFKKGGTGMDLDWLCSLGHLANDGPLSVEDQHALLRAWILHIFVPELNPNHPIPLHEGVTGTGKSVMGEAIGRWLTGPQFEVMDLPSGDTAKAEESVKLALCKRPLVVIDNVDSPAPWLEDFLCRYATGVRMSRRRLYTNNEEVYFTPRAGLIITSRDPHFRREDVARRLLPIRFAGIPPEKRLPEVTIRSQVDARRARIWADVIWILGKLQDAWPSLRASLTASHSIADFAIFGEAVVAAIYGDSARAGWRTLMGRLEQAQRGFTIETDPLVDLLRAALDESLGGVIPQQTVADFYSDLKLRADDAGLPWPFKSVSALTKALRHKRPALEQALSAKIVLTNNHQGGVHKVAITRVSMSEPKPPASGDSGDSGRGLQLSLSTADGGSLIRPSNGRVGRPPLPPSPPPPAKGVRR